MTELFSIIDYVTIDMHNADGLPTFLKETSERFGILKLKTKKVEITKKPLFILFTIDRTGSMSDSSGNGGTKIGHLKQTFKNMISYFSKIEGADIYIRVHSFNDIVEYTIETVKINSENVDELCQQIDKLTATGLTAIDLALQEASLVMKNYADTNPTHSCVHIFMTDGEPSVGKSQPGELSEMVDESFINIFVGFGASHNAHLLRKFSEKKLAEYQYIDNAENSVLMYGETIHRFLYPALNDVDIIMTEGLIYDWQTNVWTDRLHEPIIIGEMEKIYHIKESDTSIYDMEVNIYGIESTSNTGERVLLATEYIMPQLIYNDTNLPVQVDCSKYMFRQRVQELLYNARSLNEYGVDRSIQRTFKNDLADLFRNMRKYIRENGLSHDGFMKNLCDDISILYNSIGTVNGLMYAMSRQGSQGRQSTYTPGRIPRRRQNMNNSPVPLGRTTSMPVALPSYFTTPRNGLRIITTDLDLSSQDTEDWGSGSDGELSTVVIGFEEDDEIDRYTAEYTNTSCYTTPGVMDTIHTMSQVTDRK